MTREAMAMTARRAELATLADAMLTAWTRHDLREFHSRLGVMRVRARRHHMHALVALLGAMETSLQVAKASMVPWNTLRWYLDRIDDALGCAPDDMAATEAILASIAVLRVN